MTLEQSIKTLSQYGAPTNCYFAAVQHFSQNELSKIQCEEGIAELVGISPPSYDSRKQAYLHFQYLVQELVQTHENSLSRSIDDIWATAQTRALTFISNSPWSLVEDKNQPETEVSVDENGTPKVTVKGRGAKGKIAEQVYIEMNDGTNQRSTIVQQFVARAGMSVAGANTYFHLLKKKHGFIGEGEAARAKSTKMTKAKIAEIVFKEMINSSKDEIITAIAERASTSIAGATTYFHTLKNKCGYSIVTKHRRSSNKGPTKIEIAEKIFLEMKNADKGEILDAIVTATNTSKAGAYTYFCTLKKKHST